MDLLTEALIMQVMERIVSSFTVGQDKGILNMRQPKSARFEVNYVELFRNYSLRSCSFFM